MTTINQAENQARINERLLFTLYEKIFQQIEADPDYPDHPDTIKLKFKEKVTEVTRKAITEMHQTALDYVSSRFRIDTFFTNTDIDLIKEETEQTVELYFNAVRKSAEQLQQVNAQKATLTTFSLKSAAAIPALRGAVAIFKRIASTIMTSSFARGIVSKVKQLEKRPVGLFDTEEEARSKSGFSQRVRWITQLDELVCPICRPLHGRTFFVDDPAIPTPGDLGRFGTHPNCRCYFEII